MSKNPDLIFPSNSKFQRVFELIKSNYHQSISLKDIAEELSYSPAYLTTELKKHTGKTINSWINEYRIAVACKELLETDKLIEIIANEVGYQSTDYFFRQFRKHHSTTPHVWRKQQRKEQVVA